MHLLCLGINHTTAPLDLREKLVFSEESARTALARLGCGGGIPDVLEMVILSTCNRVEIYAVSTGIGFRQIEDFLSQVHGIPFEQLRSHLYHYTDEHVVSHLFRVSTGLDSLVLGEPQILGQVTRALELSLGVGACGAMLSRLFRTAIHAGKRAHSETAISRNPVSVSSLAAALAAREVRDLQNAQVLVIGAGEMAQLAVEALRKRGAANIMVANRTLQRAQELAERWQADASTFEHLESLLLAADIVITSTGAPHLIIKASFMRDIMQARSHRPLAMIDIAVPRDIDPEVGSLAGVKLFDIDHLDQQVKRSLADRTSQVPLVEAILLEEQSAYLEYFHALDVLPVISMLRQQAEAVREAELDKTLRRLPDLTEAERSRVEAMSRAIVKKLLAAPTQRLREEANSPRSAEYASIARTLFDLPDQSYFN